MNGQCFFKDDVVTIKPEFKEKMSSIGLGNYEGLFMVIYIVKNTINSIAITKHLRTGRRCYIPTEYLQQPVSIDMPITLL